MHKNKQIVGLDALRFLAAAFVLIFHLGFWNWTRADSYHAPFPAAYTGLIPFAWFGSVGVEIFFVLSGFVIAYSAQRTPALLFLQHRITRLLPAAVICASLTAIVLLVLDHAFTPGTVALLWLKSVTFYPIGPWVDNAYWTLRMEVSFYALVFTLLLFKRFEWMPAIIASIGGLSTIFWIALSLPAHWRIAIQLHPVIRALEVHLALNMLLVHHGCYFAIGVYLWLCLYAHRGKAWTPARIAVLAVCALGGVLQILVRVADLERSSGYRSSSLVPVAVWLGAVVYIVTAVIKNDAIHSVIGSSAASVFRRLARITYPLSLLHQAIGVQLIQLFARHLSAAESWILAVTIVVGLAYVVSNKAEPVLQGVLKRWLAPSPAVSVTA